MSTLVRAFSHPERPLPQDLRAPVPARLDPHQRLLDSHSIPRLGLGFRHSADGNERDADAMAPLETLETGDAYRTPALRDFNPVTPAPAA